MAHWIGENCIGCGACARICAHGAPQFGADGKATIDTAATAAGEQITPI